MGGYFALIGSSLKNKPLYIEQKFSLEDIDLIDNLMITGLRFEYDLFDSMMQLDKYAFSIEKCKCIVDFLLLIRRNFLREAHFKEKLFGRSFENMDCPSLTRCFAPVITSSLTFKDDFVFVGRIANDIPFSRLHYDYIYDYMRLVVTVIPHCKLSRIQLIIKAVTSCSTHKIDQQETDGQNSKIRQSRS